MLKEFKAFALKGNMVDLAIGIILGIAFGVVVQSLVKDIIMPPIGLLLGNVDFSNWFIVLKEGVTPGPYFTIDQAVKAGAVTLNIGLFINSLIGFIIVAFAVFMIVKALKKMEKEEVKAPEPVIRKCPYCFSAIDEHATRCPYCTSDLVVREMHAK
ncbi:MAG: large conductance mechanosensitive channel protein MscL [Ignavibacteria bacterium]|jgi:large conductance mechanosensitive channel|nr:large conductance mechanosensitive channel protein MscL [Ignavibacteria bacterium]MCU7514296.1 large conductance mechanosensitive channel protein MscL [Ignavibacteria bacterium]MCU7522422.1 large conductance mechanosensitive channel protein MscL [Ignavibacteria bacterium]